MVANVIHYILQDIRKLIGVFVLCLEIKKSLRICITSYLRDAYFKKWDQSDVR